MICKKYEKYFSLALKHKTGIVVFLTYQVFRILKPIWLYLMKIFRAKKGGLVQNFSVGTLRYGFFVLLDREKGRNSCKNRIEKRKVPTFRDF